jgi:hypothetical protein
VQMSPPLLRAPHCSRVMVLQASTRVATQVESGRGSTKPEGFPGSTCSTFKVEFLPSYMYSPQV